VIVEIIVEVEGRAKLLPFIFSIDGSRSIEGCIKTVIHELREAQISKWVLHTKVRR